MAEKRIPKEAMQALNMIEELLGSSAVAVYLYGSAVVGGLRKDSDVDVMTVINHGLSEISRRNLADRLLAISGKVGNADFLRPLEVTVIRHDDVVPWKYPPKKEFIYGEWLRGIFEQGRIPEPAYDPDLTIILSQVRYSSIALLGGDASEILTSVPMADIKRAMKDCLPDLMHNLKGDERNVILTLARMWVTAATGEFLPKDEAAKWAIPHLPKEQASLLELAGKAYRGEYVDLWENLDLEVAALVHHLKKEIAYCLA